MSETLPFDEGLFDKPKGIVAERGRRCAAEKWLAREDANREILTKYFHDPQQIIEQRCKDRLLGACSDNLECNVMYSMNKKNRWQVTAASLVADANTSDVDVAVVEKVCTSKDAGWFGTNSNQERVNSLYLLDKNGDVTIRSARGWGFKVCDVRTGSTGTEKNQKKKKSKKDRASKGDAESESNEKDGERARIEYRISRNHANCRILMGKICGPDYYQRKPRRIKKVDISEWEGESDGETSSDVDESGVDQQSRGFRSCLGDFITTSKSLRSDRRDTSDRLEQAEVKEKEVAGTEKPRERVDGATKTAEVNGMCDSYEQSFKCLIIDDDLLIDDEDALFEKPKRTHAEKGRRCGIEKMYARLETDRVLLTKQVEDPQQVLGKRRKARILNTCNDNLDVNVVYSLNRKNRWQIDAADFLKDADTSEVDVSVAEKVYTDKCPTWWYDRKRGKLNSSTNGRVNSVQLLDKDGNIKAKSAKRFGAKISTLLADDNNKKKSKKERVSSVGDAENESFDEEGERARIEYMFSKPHSNSRILIGKITRRDYYGKRPHRNKNVDLSELESDLESIHIEDNDADKPNRDFSFCLGDFMAAKPKSDVVVERLSSSESLKQVEVVEKDVLMGDRPQELLDISVATKAPAVFEEVTVDATKWPDYTFAKQVDSLSSSSPSYIVRWLDANHQRASVDVTPKTGGPDDGTVKAVVVLEKCRKNAFRLLFNCAITPSDPFSAGTLNDVLLGRGDVLSIQKAVEVLAGLAYKWQKRYDRTGASDLKTLFLHDALFYQPSVNSMTMAKNAKVISAPEMADLLRHYGKLSYCEPFERMPDDDFDTASDVEDLNGEDLIFFSAVKCISCKTSSMEDLFELDDYWQCRDCLRQHIVNLLRTKNIPLEIPFITDIDGFVYDVLPALIPLPIINYYTKLAATDLLKLCDSEFSDLLECPGCRETVKVDRPNEFHSCRCSSCGILWCSDCLAEPHWPVPCQKYKEWMEKWMQQYPVERLSDEVIKILHCVTCKCGGIVEIGDDCEEARRTCSGCRTEINTKSLKIVGKLCDVNTYTNKKRKKEHALKVDELPVVHHINKEIAKPCAEARQLRFNKSRSTEIAKQCRRIKGIPAVTNLPLLRTTVLYLVEMGLAWLYMTKSTAQGMKSQLVQLLKILEEVELELEQNKPTLADRVQSLESSMEKAKDMLKKAVAAN